MQAYENGSMQFLGTQCLRDSSTMCVFRMFRNEVYVGVPLPTHFSTSY